MAVAGARPHLNACIRPAGCYLAPIGDGGIEELWNARDTPLDRIFAITRLKDE